MKKLSEMENALRKASGQVERANAAVRKLEVENAALSREMEDAKLHAAESAASCQEVSMREKKTQMKFQSWEKHKSLFLEELMTEKHKLEQLLQELEQAKVQQEQVEVFHFELYISRCFSFINTHLIYLQSCNLFVCTTQAINIISFCYLGVYLQFL